MTIFGIDVDQGRGVIDWPKVAASGIKFAIIRCVREGDLGVDVFYARNVAGARANALTPGAYCFLSGGGRATVQAKLFVATVGDPTGMLIVPDVESGALPPTAADLRAFVGVLRAAWPTHPLLIYGGNLLRSLGRLVDLGPLWLADYGGNAVGSPAAIYAGRGGAAAAQWRSTFGGWTHPVIWQFGSKGRVPGISGNVDMDAIETADLAALTGSTVTSEVPMFITQSLGHCVTVTDARVYPEPGGVAIHSAITKGTRLRVFGGAAGWRWVQLSLGGVESYGWVRADEVSSDPEPLTVSDGAPPVVPTAPDTTPFSQADVAAKVAAAVTADRANARITYG
jgi:GH25 family lysozyme M1 (1,4-beta-N-acetylmuramidase)